VCCVAPGLKRDQPFTIAGALGKNGTSPSPVQGNGLVQKKRMQRGLDLVYSERTLRAYFNAGLTTETLISFNGFCFAVDHFENLSRTCCYTFFVSTALIFVYQYFEHCSPPKSEIKNKYSSYLIGNLNRFPDPIALCHIALIHGQFFVKQKRPFLQSLPFPPDFLDNIIISISFSINSYLAEHQAAHIKIDRQRFSYILQILLTVRPDLIGRSRITGRI
jgi:hypothetical protein